MANEAIEVWDDVTAVDVCAVMLLSKHALPHLRLNRGSIINTASTHAFAGDMVLTGYNAARAALIALTKYSATQYGHEGCDRMRSARVPR
ncbi:SDR family oxidoreductase [Rhodococcus wratislaviensis]|uniref:SDR family oxidoreductase n=1 Tax=Rhodococcus wratislaviensis TaxID=44752 RepID=UPI0036478C3A